jgi:hypothetical protein
VETLTKKRANNLRMLLLVQLGCYCIYWGVVEYGSLLYLYMLKLFPGFTPAQFANLSIAGNLVNMLVIFGVIPVLSGRFKLHESTVLVCICSVTCIGYFLTTLPRQVWPGMYLVGLLDSFAFAQYSQARSLFTKCVEPDEVGKIFSAVAIIAALAPLASNLIMRKLYNATLATFPQAFIMFTGSLYVVAALGNLFLFTRRSSMQGIKPENEEEDKKEDKKELESKNKTNSELTSNSEEKL